MKKKKKKAITLIEIMIVILLIGIIGGTLAFNMRGSLDEGKVFKTEQNITRLHDILMLEYARGNGSLDEVKSNAPKIVKSSPLAKGDSILKDGWNQPLSIQVDKSSEELIIKSSKLDAYKAKKSR